MAGRTGDGRRSVRWSAVALLVGGAGWLVAGLLIVWQPFALRAEPLYATLMPAVLLALFAGTFGLRAWLDGFQPKPRRRPRARGLSSGLEAMSSRRHQAVDSAGAGNGAGRLSARGVGIGTVRVGALFVTVSSLLMGGGTGLRSTLFFGWFLFFAGWLVVGIVVAVSEDLPSWPGALLALGSLLVASVYATVMGGGTGRPAAFGPLLPAGDSVPALGLSLWALAGAAWAWLGAALWVRASRPAAAR